MAAITATESSRIEAACRDLMLRFARTLNRRDIDGFTALFTPDAQWRMQDLRPLRDRAQLRRLLTRLWARPDAVPFRLELAESACWIEVESADRARGSTRGILYRDRQLQTDRALQPDVVALYHDVFVRTGDGWRIGEHHTLHLYRSAACAAQRHAGK